MIYYKSRQQIELIRESALLVSATLAMIASEIKPGISLLQLDTLAEDYIRSYGGIPGFLGLYDFPNSLCMSKNHVVVHGIPDKTELKEGDIISVDCGVLKNRYYGDHAYTFAIGEVDKSIINLLKTTKESLYKGIEQCIPGKRTGDIGYAIQSFCENQGFGVVKKLVGHGLGRKLHEEPQIPNYGIPGRGTLLKNGMTLAIEPMINMGTDDVKEDVDNWTIITCDGLPSAHFEHNVAIIDGHYEILSDYSQIENNVKMNPNLVNF